MPDAVQLELQVDPPVPVELLDPVGPDPEVVIDPDPVVDSAPPTPVVAPLSPPAPVVAEVVEEVVVPAGVEHPKAAPARRTARNGVLRTLVDRMVNDNRKRRATASPRGSPGKAAPRCDLFCACPPGVRSFLCVGPVSPANRREIAVRGPAPP
jgi:hypothetical protein